MDGIILTPLKQIHHPKGDIYHAMKKSDIGFENFGEAYFSTIIKNDIKGWKKHTKMTLNLIVPSGEIEFVIYDEIKNEFFNLISTFDEKSVQTYSYILEKPKVSPDKRKEKDKFYIENLSFSIQRLLDKLEIDKNFIIITDRLPVQKNKSKQVGALKKGIKEYIKSKKLNLRYDIFHHCSASSANLQIVDYISWAIFRKFEHKDDTFYKKIEKYLIGLDEMTKDRKVSHYKK